MSEKLLRLSAVEDQTGLSRSVIYRMIKAGEFPAPIQLTGARAVAWPSSSVDTWIQSRIASAKNRGEVRQ